MPITRRQFLKRTGLMTAGAVAGPSLFRNPLLQHALAATDNYLLVFYLDGGNDGLNTIVPYDNGGVGAGGLRDMYMLARNGGNGGLRLAPNDLLVPAPPMLDPNTGSQLGFHPGLQGIADLYDDGNVAVVQGVGYPDPNLSHDESSRRWETGDPFEVLPAGGWVGRYLAGNYGGSEIPGVTIRNTVAPEFEQGTTGVLALRNVNDVAFPYPNASMSEIAFLSDAFGDIHADASLSSLLPFRHTGTTGANVQLATEAYALLDTDYVSDRAAFNDLYTGLGTGIARDIREIAKVIYGVANDTYPGIVTAHFFEVRQGGYDTHSDQGAGGAAQRQFGLFEDMSQAIKLFYEDVSTMAPGLGQKITILVWSEFSRRIKQNDTGTDHGSQGPVFLIGGGLNGGVVGNHPNIDPIALNADGNTVYSQDGGDGFRSTDLRDIYGTVLKHWLGMADPSPFLPVDSGAPETRWTAPDFDLALFAP